MLAEYTVTIPEWVVVVPICAGGVFGLLGILLGWHKSDEKP